MRTVTIEKTLYKFDELEESAKDNARNWFRGCLESEELTDYDDWQSVARILGIEFSQRQIPLHGGGTRYDPQIYWTLNPDRAAFAGRYSYAKGAPKAIRAYAPNDTVLHGIADRLREIQRKAFYRLTADCETRGRNGTSQQVQCYRMPIDGTYNYYIDHDELEECLTDFAHWICCQISAQWDYLNSDEYVDECILINGYEFDESGNIA